MRGAVQDTIASWRAELERVGDRATRRSSVRSPARGSHGARRSKTSLSASRSSSTACGCSSATASPDRATLTRSGGSTLGRATEIGRVATRHGFGYLLDRRRATDGEPDADRGRRLREMFDELGPTFVKFGQLSTRPDVVPPDIVELQAPGRGLAFLDRGRRAGVRTELGLTIEQAFLAFDERRSARSIGQVHRATLPNEVDVVVKVQRPRRRARSSPTSLMASAARGARARASARLHRHERARGRVRALDPARARLPAGGAQRRDVPPELRGDDRIAVPRVWWRYTTGRILTLDRLDGPTCGTSTSTPGRQRTAARSHTR